MVESHQSYALYDLSSKFLVNTHSKKKPLLSNCISFLFHSSFFLFVFITFIKILWTCKIGQKLVGLCFVVLLPSCLYKNIDVCRATEKFSCSCCLLLVFCVSIIKNIFCVILKILSNTLLSISHHSTSFFSAQIYLYHVHHIIRILVLCCFCDKTLLIVVHLNQISFLHLQNMRFLGVLNYSLNLTDVLL